MSDLIAEIMRVASESAASLLATDKLETAAIAANDKIRRDAAQAAGLETNLVVAENNKKAKVQAGTELIRESMGGNLELENNLLLANARAFDVANRKSLQLQDSILKKQSIEFLDDPMGWFGAQLTIDDDVNAYNTASSMADKASEKIREIESTVSESNKARMATMQTLDAQGLQDKNKLDAIKINIQQSVLEHQLLGQDVVSMDHMKNGRTAQLEFSLKANEVRRQQASDARAERGEARAQKQFELSLEQHNKKLDADKEFLTAINYGRGSLQLPPMSESELDNMSRTDQGKAMLGKLYDNYLQNAGETLLAQKQENAAAAAQGRKPVMVTRTAPTVGNSPYEVFSTAKITGARFSADPMAAKTYGLIQAAASEAQESEKFKLAKPNEQLGVFTSELNAKVKDKIAAMSKNAEIPGSIFKAPDDPREVITANPTAANSAFFMKVIAPQLQAGRSRFTSADMLAMGQDYVKTGMITAEEAASGIATYYQGVANYNTVRGNFQGMAVGRQESYVVKPDFGTLNKQGKSIDLTKPADLALYFAYMKLHNQLRPSSTILKDNSK